MKSTDGSSPSTEGGAHDGNGGGARRRGAQDRFAEASKGRARVLKGRELFRRDAPLGTDDEEEIVATVHHMLETGHVRLCGIFRDIDPRKLR